MFRMVRFNAFDDVFFRCKIGLGHKIDIALHCDVRDPTELFHQDMSGLAGSFDCEIEHNQIQTCRGNAVKLLTGMKRIKKISHSHPLYPLYPCPDYFMIARISVWCGAVMMASLSVRYTSISDLIPNFPAR